MSLEMPEFTHSAVMLSYGTGNVREDYFYFFIFIIGGVELSP
jgi:hypothetical protein